MKFDKLAELLIVKNGKSIKSESYMGTPYRGGSAGDSLRSRERGAGVEAFKPSGAPPASAEQIAAAVQAVTDNFSKHDAHRVAYDIMQWVKNN